MVAIKVMVARAVMVAAMKGRGGASRVMVVMVAQIFWSRMLLFTHTFVAFLRDDGQLFRSRELPSRLNRANLLNKKSF